jgi:raffinose/stachyose/melibiose transport system substrate-binding protein
MKKPTVLRLGLAIFALLLATTGLTAQVTLKFWTWAPSADVYKPAIDKFQAQNPNIKIDIQVLESKNFQEKAPLALSTGEDLDIVGVQAGAMAGQVAPFLADLDPLLTKVDPNWQSKYSKLDVETSKSLTDGKLKAIFLLRVGAMVGYYNAKMFKDYGLTIPKTIEDYKKLADTLKAKNKDILPAAINGKDAWTMDELMLTVMGQTGDYYNQWRYKKAPVDSPQFISALKDFKKFFDLGIFTKDTLDFDYGRSQDLFTSGKAATYFQGSWEGSLASSVLRKDRKIALEDVGVFALPVVQPSGKPSLRSYIEDGLAIPSASKHPAEAAKFIAFLAFGEGIELMSGKDYIASPSKLGVPVSTSLFTTKAGLDGAKLLAQLVANPTADRNNVSGYSDIEGASVQKVVEGLVKPEDEVKALQKEWTSGKY